MNERASHAQTSAPGRPAGPAVAKTLRQVAAEMAADNGRAVYCPTLLIEAAEHLEAPDRLRDLAAE